MNPILNASYLPHVVIIGAGFGGLHAAKALAKAPVRITLLDQHNYHLFQPLLYQVATAGISADEIAYPVRSILRRQKNFEFRLAQVQSIDPQSKQVLTASGPIPFDYLIVAAGGVTQTFDLPGIEDFAFGLKNLQDAGAIRNHLLRMFELANETDDPEKRASILRFVIAGGGPTGVEMAGAIAELTRMVLKKDYPYVSPADVQVIMLEAADSLLPAMPAALSAHAASVLHDKQVEIRFQAAVAAYDGQSITFRDGQTLAAQTLIWAAGIKANPLVSSLGQPTGSLGRVLVEPTLNLPANPDIFVIGDAALLKDTHGAPLPMVAPVAMQQAETAARNIMALITASPLVEFIYHDPGSLATIGKNQAVARLGPLQFTGFFAWLIWLFVHLMQLVGFRNRLIVLLKWIWDYLFYDRAVRLIEPARRR
jgi:NADH dehydrogenase